MLSLLLLLSLKFELLRFVRWELDKQESGTVLFIAFSTWVNKNLELFYSLVRVYQWAMWRHTLTNHASCDTKLCQMLSLAWFFFSENYIRDTNFWHNFVPQLSTWRVVIGKDMSVDHVETYSYQSQLAMWRVVT